MVRTSAAIRFQARVADRLEGQSVEETRGDIGNRIGEQTLRSERETDLDRLREPAAIYWRNTGLRAGLRNGVGASA